MSDFRVGGLARNKNFGWVGKVIGIECARCGALLVDGKFMCSHVNFPLRYLSVEQGGFLKPWCLEKDYAPTTIGPSVWELLRNNPLDDPARNP